MTRTTTETAATAMTAVKLAEERAIILHLDNAPHMTNYFGTLAPYAAWITYRLEAGETEHTWRAQVSGHRVRPNKPVDPTDTASIDLRSGLDEDETPEWLTELIAAHTPTW